MHVCELKVLFQITSPLCVVCLYLFRLVISPHEMFRFFTAPFFFAKPPLTRKTICLFRLSTLHFMYKRYITFGWFGVFYSLSVKLWKSLYIGIHGTVF